MFNDHNKHFLFHTVLFNDRLRQYAFYVQNAKDNGYIVLPMCEFYKLPDRRSEQHFVLRHDVDHPGKCTRKMFEIERTIGVKSTYYFRFSTIDKSLIDEMIKEGFEVGLHFETISDFAREKGIVDKSKIDIEMMRERLKNEIKCFEDMIGHPIQSCCSHGALENTILGMSNNILTEGQDMSIFGVQFEAYDASMYDDVDCHIMDGSILNNYGFSYIDTPKSAVDQKKRNIIFLAHPNHWRNTLKERMLIIRGLLLGKATYSTTRKFMRIAQ